MKYKIICVLVMFLATYLPRALPLILFRKKIKLRFLQSFLFYMPYAVLATLTFPSIFYSTGDIYTAVIGTAVALCMSFFKVNLAIVSLVCAATVFGLGYII